MNSYTGRSAALEPRHSQLDVLVSRTAYTTAYHPRHLGTLLARIGKHVMHWLTTGSLPRITKTMQGDTEVWKVYDPITNRTHYFDDEADLRVWMEERYYLG
jgi:hypothetical protein